MLQLCGIAYATVAPLDIGHVMDGTTLENYRSYAPDNEAGDEEWNAFWERNTSPECHISGFYCATERFVALHSAL
jgi:hypothetical protein